jgi:hypothetical protein
MTKHLAIAVVLAAACGGSSKGKPDAPADAAPDAALVTINGSAFLNFIDGSGSNTTAFNPTAITVTSASLDGSAWVIETGTYAMDGTFSVPVVKGDGTYDISFEVGSAADGAVPIYIVGNTTSPDFSQVDWVKLPATFPSEATPTALSVTGMTSWGTIDDMEIMDPGNGALIFSPYLAALGGSGAPTGKTTYTGTFDWDKQTNMQLMNSGDVVDIWQLATAGSAGNEYAAIANLGTTTAPTQINGSGGSLTVAMTAVDQNETLAVDFQHDAFEALKGDVGGTGAKDSAGLQTIFIDAGPFAYNNGQYTATPDLVEWGAEAAIPAGSDVLQTFKYGNPFTLTGSAGGTAMDEYLIINYFFDTTITAPAASAGTTLTLGITEDLPTSGTGGLGSGTNTLAPQVTPVTAILVNGQASAGATGAGETPTISWTAPATGTVTGYNVALEKVANNNDQTALTEIALFDTTATSLQIPTGLITSGTNVGYAVIIFANVEPGWDPTTAPFHTPMPVAEISAVSGVFTP